jgi:ATP-dependent helicase HrpB
VEKLDELAWLTPPPLGAFQQALNLLAQLGAVGESSNLTNHGKEMALFPAHPRLAHMLLRGAKVGLADEACRLAAALAEPGRPAHYGDDAEQWLSAIDHPKNKSCPWTQRVKQQSATFRQALSALIKPPSEKAPTVTTPCGFLIAQAYPDRIAKQRENSAVYQLSNGRSANLPNGHSLQKYLWLAVAESGGMVGNSEDRIYCAAELDPALFQNELSDHVKVTSTISWHLQNQRLMAEKHYRVGALLLRAERITDLTRDQKTQAILDFIRAQGLSVLPWTDACVQLRARVQLVRAQKSCQQPDLPSWPDFSDEGLLATMNDWLSPFIESVNALHDFKKLDLFAMLSSLLPWPLGQKLDQWVPTHITVPSGSVKSLDYTQNPPVLAVKLQEMFGCDETPKVANGGVALLVHLLSPSQKPLQITQDLAGFWRSSYQEVKKEMKGRYPKHPWPDDPTQAVPTRFTKKKMQ